MKKGLILTTINWILVFSIPGILLTGNIDSSVINSSIDPKNINTDIIKQVLKTEDVKTELDINKEKEEKDKEKEKIEELEIPDIRDNTKKEEKKEQTEVKEEVKKEDSIPVIKEEKKPVQAIATYSGSASYYTANCYGCGGYTSSGLNVGDGRLFYNDSTYGDVRIIAAGREIPLYSIVRINNTSLGASALAIVLDRGGDIGDGRKFIIDILTNDSEGIGGVDRNVSVEVLRSGR